MSRAASHSHQAGEGSAFAGGSGDDIGTGQPFDPFEDMPHGICEEEIGFGSLAFEDSVIVERTGHHRAARRGNPADPVARLRLSRAFARG